MRYLPAESNDRDMFGWHHDMEEQRMKMMVLLTDVGETDQYMSYVTGSHRLFHPFEMFSQNHCSLEYCRERLEELELFHTTGMAGDVFLFDSNGAHRGNRRTPAAVRDVFFIEYCANQTHVWGGDIDAQIFDSVDPMCASVFTRMRTVDKKWDRPRRGDKPDWIASLADIEGWL